MRDRDERRLCSMEDGKRQTQKTGGSRTGKEKRKAVKWEGGKSG